MAPTGGLRRRRPSATRRLRPADEPGKVVRAARRRQRPDVLEPEVTRDLMDAPGPGGVLAVGELHGPQATDARAANRGPTGSIRCRPAGLHAPRRSTRPAVVGWTTACTRSRSPSLGRTWPTWVLTVVSAREVAAISRVGKGPGQLEQLALARRRGCRGAGRWWPPAGRCEVLDQPPGQPGGEDTIAGGDSSDGRHQLGWRDVLEQEAARPGAQRGEHVLVEVERREDEHRGDAAPSRDPTVPRCRPARHADVHQHDVGGRGGQPPRRASRPSRPRRRRSCPSASDHPAARPAPAPGRRRGRRGHVAAAERTPSRRRRAAGVSVPPYTATRSRIPVSPWPCFRPRDGAPALRRRVTVRLDVRIEIRAQH